MVRGKVDVYRVVYVGPEGNQQALVFQEPTEGKSFQENEMWILPGATAAPVNDEGDIPHREGSGQEGENLGVTWHWQK